MEIIKEINKRAKVLEYKDIISASRILYDVLPSDIAREMRESIMERYGNTWAIDFSVSNDFKPHVSKQHSYIYRELQFAIASILSNTDRKKACSDYQKLSRHKFVGDDKLIEKFASLLNLENNKSLMEMVELYSKYNKEIEKGIKAERRAYYNKSHNEKVKILLTYNSKLLERDKVDHQKYCENLKRLKAELESGRVGTGSENLTGVRHFYYRSQAVNKVIAEHHLSSREAKLLYDFATKKNLENFVRGQEPSEK